MATRIANRLFFVLVASLLTLPVPAAFVRAQSTTSAAKLGVTVSPVIEEIKVRPGESVSQTVKLTNPVRDKLTLYPSVLNAYSDTEDGKPKFYSLNQRSSPYAVSDWVSFPQPSAEIAPGESVTFTFIVKAPTDAEPGGHYGAVLFSTEPPQLQADTSQVAVVGLVGTLLLVTVPGNLKDNTLIESFDGPRVLVRPPANFSLLFTNHGNIHAQPTGELKIRNWSGDVSAILKINDVKGNVLPGSQRRFDESWNFDWKAIGRYTATVAVTYGNPEQVLTATRTFYVIPLWLIGIVLLLVLMIVIWWRRKHPQRKSQPPEPVERSKGSRIVMR